MNPGDVWLVEQSEAQQQHDRLAAKFYPQKQHLSS